MPQMTLSNGELVKKTVKITLVMVGTTVVWLGALTGVVMATTTSSADVESKGERGSSPSTMTTPGITKPGTATPAPGMNGMKGAAAPIRQPRRSLPGAPAPKSAGDPI